MSLPGPNTGSAPDLLHYCWFGPPLVSSWKLPLAAFICMSSALDRLRPRKTILWTDSEPQGDYWKRLSDRIEVRPVEAKVNAWGRKPILHPAHKADKLRLEVLYQHGGIYLDVDVLVLKAFDDLLGFETVMGREGECGLCNAVLISRPASRFIGLWMESYGQHFQPLGWSEASIHLPLRIAEAHPLLVEVLPETAFFYPSWQESGRVFEEPNVLLTESYAYHLWASSCARILGGLTERSILSGSSHFARIAREYLRA